VLCELVIHPSLDIDNSREEETVEPVVEQSRLVNPAYKDDGNNTHAGGDKHCFGLY
jgi:hypothetical protein